MTRLVIQLQIDGVWHGTVSRRLLPQRAIQDAIRATEADNRPRRVLRRGIPIYQTRPLCSCGHSIQDHTKHFATLGEDKGQMCCFQCFAYDEEDELCDCSSYEEATPNAT